MALAFPNRIGDFFHLSNKEIEEGVLASRTSDRKRMILPIHRTQDAIVQRIVNFMQPETYIRPHKHPREFASETVALVKGGMIVIHFSETGNIINTYELDDKKPFNLIDIEPDKWHGMIITQPDTIVFEFKRGPYDKDDDKSFAKWAPEEFSVEAEDYNLNLKKRLGLNG